MSEMETMKAEAFIQGMVEAAVICGSLAETTYDDSDGFEAATGCEAQILRAAAKLRAQLRSATPTSETAA